MLYVGATSYFFSFAYFTNKWVNSRFKRNLTFALYCEIFTQSSSSQLPCTDTQRVAWDKKCLSVMQSHITQM